MEVFSVENADSETVRVFEQGLTIRGDKPGFPWILVIVAGFLIWESRK